MSIQAPQALPEPWTKDRVIALLARNDDAVGHALLALYARQTRDEQAHHTTKHVNGRGFSGFDAEVMTSMALFYKRIGSLTPKQLAYLRQPGNRRPHGRIGKYAGQLAEVANDRIEAMIYTSEMA